MIQINSNLLYIKITKNELNLAIIGLNETSKAMISAICCVQGSCVKQENREVESRWVKRNYARRLLIKRKLFKI